MGVVYSCSCKNLNNEIGDSQNTETDRNCVQNLYAVRPNLVFPNEILEKILSFLSTRDKLVARQVCMNWCLHVNEAGNLQETVRVNASSDELGYLAATSPVFAAFHFHKLDITRQSLNFWRAYSDIITHVDFYDCSIIPRNTVDSTHPSFNLGCPNLKYLGLVNCDKYFLMGGTFIQIDEILCLENLETLNLSQNKNLSDSILFSILLKTKRLQRIDLSDCVNMVFMKAVHNRFYPAAKPCPPYSDHVLSFHTLCKDFLQTNKANEMVGFNFGMRFNSTGMALLLTNDNVKWKHANLESPELKTLDIVQFISKFHQTLVEIDFGRCKLNTDDLFGANLFSLQNLSICDSRSISSLQFLATMPNLNRLVIDGANGFDLNANCFANVPNLKELSLNGIKPTNSPNLSRTELLKIFETFPNLKTLDIGNCPQIVNDEVVRGAIQYLKKLRRLNLETSSLSEVGMGTTIANLNIWENICLSKIADLEYLNLSHCRELNELTWQMTERLMNLTCLNLSNCNTLSKRGILSIIDNCRNLEKLTLMHCSTQILTDTEVVVACREKLFRCKAFAVVSVHDMSMEDGLVSTLNTCMKDIYYNVTVGERLDEIR